MVSTIGNGDALWNDKDPEFPVEITSDNPGLTVGLGILGWHELLLGAPVPCDCTRCHLTTWVEAGTLRFGDRINGLVDSCREVTS